MANNKFMLYRSGDLNEFCSACGAGNYEGEEFLLFRLRIKNTAHYLCPDCLRKLIGMATVELIKMDMEDK